MTAYGYIIMIIVDSCVIWFNFDCIMQLKKSYRIATNVCRRKSATTLGDLPDCSVQSVTIMTETHLMIKFQMFFMIPNAPIPCVISTLGVWTGTLRHLNSILVVCDLSLLKLVSVRRG